MPCENLVTARITTYHYGVNVIVSILGDSRDLKIGKCVVSKRIFTQNDRNYPGGLSNLY